MISVIIPHWGMDDELNAALKRCVNSLEGHDELVLVINDGIGFGPAVNQGLSLANGDYLIIVNNDTILESGNLADLCDPEAVTVPQMKGQIDNNPRAFYCMPRWVYEKVGGYDERFTYGYFEDDDLMRRWIDAEVPIRTVPSVHVDHVGGLTMKKLQHELIYERNKELFNEKWS
jgi:O-antigen biosynthesis protein